MSSMSEQTLANPRPVSIPVFCFTQLLIVGIVTGAVLLRFRALQQQRELPPLREVPHSVSLDPQYDFEVVVTDEQLVRVLRKVRPRDLGGKTKINHIDHGLRFWGTEVEFRDPRFISGPEMRRRLLDNRRFEELYGESTQSLLIDGADGVAVRVQAGLATSSHVDHTIAGLAEVGTNLDFPIVPPAGPKTYQAMLLHSLRNFSLNQAEYEWSALAYSLFMPPNRQFVTREGQTVDFDMLAERLMREEMPAGVCFGMHRLHALVMMLRIQEHVPLLTEQSQQRVVAYLKGMTNKLVQSQRPEGCWDGSWSGRAAAKAADASNPFEVRRDQLLATGHAMEWWALAPSELHPPRHVLAAAGQWLVLTIDELSEEDVIEYYTFLTHAGRALALWRGVSDPGRVAGVEL